MSPGWSLRFSVCRTNPPHGIPKYASRCWWWFQQSVATRSPRSRPSFCRATASCFERRAVSLQVERWKDLSGCRVTTSLSPKNVSARRSRGGSVSWKSIISPFTPEIVLDFASGGKQLPQQQALVHAVAPPVGEPLDSGADPGVAADEIARLRLLGRQRMLDG